MILGVVGPFGETNFGDYAMFVNNIYSIQPDESIVFTYNGILLNSLKETYLKNNKVQSVIVKNTYQYETTYGNSYKVQYDDEVLIPTQILDYICNEEEIRNAIRRIDILFVCGGGFMNRVWNAKHRKGKILSIIGTMLIANEEHKKIVLGGNTFGPFGESSEFYKSVFLSMNNIVYATRDNIYSVANLRRLGIEDKIALLPDDLYFLQKQFMDCKPNIQMTLPEKYIVLELYCSLKELEKNIEEINSFINLMNQRYELKVVFVSLDRGFGGERQGEMLEELCNLIIWHFDNEIYRKVEDVLYIVRHAQFVLCQRYHLFLFAIANNIPVYQILKNVCSDKQYYYSKSNGALRQIFCNQVYKERNYFTHSIISGLREVAANYEYLVQEQRNQFNYKKEKAEKQMKQARWEYIEKNLRK